MDDGDNKNALEFGDFVYERLREVGLRTLDHLIAKAMYLIGLAYEKNHMMAAVRSKMFEAYKSACLRHD